MEATYKTYWKTWGILLALTVVMVFVDVMSFPRLLMLVILLGAMMTKAFLIATEFMDLKHERPIVGYAIAISILFFGTFLFAFIAPGRFRRARGGALMRLALALVVFLAVAPSLGAQCAMCRTALEGSEQGRAMAVQFNHGILFLLGAPFTVAAGIGVAMLRSRKKLESF